MKEIRKLSGEYFCGNKASSYAIENGYLDYQTLAKAFDAVMANDLISRTNGVGYWYPEHGDWCSYYNDDGEEISREEYEENGGYEEETEIYQWFIVDGNGAEIIGTYTNDLVLYNEELDLYLWGVSHWGTSWDYVLTDVKLNCGADAYND